MSAKIDGRVARSIRAQAHRDQVAAALRDSPRPVRAGDLGEGIGYSWLDPCNCNDARYPRSREHYGDGWDILKVRPAAHITPELTTLAKAGLASREKAGPNRRDAVFWSWVGVAVDMTSVQYLDFETPSETDVAIDDLKDDGVQIEWVPDELVSVSGVTCPGSIEWRRNGALKYFKIELWSGADRSAIRAALQMAVTYIKDPQSPLLRSEPGTAYCLG